MHDLRAASTEPPTSAGGPAPRLDGLSTHSAWHPWRRRAGETGSCFTRSMCPPGSGLGGNWRPRLSAAGPRGSCSVFPNLSAQVQSEGTVIYPSASSPGSAQVACCSRASRLSPPRAGGEPSGWAPSCHGRSQQDRALWPHLAVHAAPATTCPDCPPGGPPPTPPPGEQPHLSAGRWERPGVAAAELTGARPAPHLAVTGWLLG